MMGHREPLKGGDEYDYLTKARRFYGHPRDAKAIKRRYGKRTRAAARENINHLIDTLCDKRTIDNE